jgi:hypothetical protein
MYIQSLLKKMTESNNPQPIKLSANQGSGANKIELTLKTTRLIMFLQDRLESIIPWSIRGRLQVSLGKDRKLILLATDSIALTQVRMMLPAIQRLFKDIREQIQHNPRWRSLGVWQDDIIKMKVMPKNPSTARKTKPAKPISGEAGKALRELAENCGDCELSDVLKKLASHAN